MNEGVFFTACAVVAVGLVAGSCAIFPQYGVYSERLGGEAEFARAESNRRVKVLEAQAALDSAKLTNQAEVERAKGVAEANKIIGDSLRDNEQYLRYLWITNLENEGADKIIYIPTEANLPILEAGKR